MAKYLVGEVGTVLRDLTDAATSIPVSGAAKGYSPFILRLNLPEYDKGADSPTRLQLASFSEANSVILKNKETRDQAKATYSKLLPTIKDTFNFFNYDYYKNVSNSMFNDSYNKQGLVNDPVTLTDIRYQRALIGSNPEITLLINPRNFSVTHTKLQNNDQITRSGSVFQSLLGEGTIQIQCSGRIGAYATSASRATNMRGDPTKKNTVDGINYFSKVDSASYGNFIDILNVFLNNGAIFDNFGKSRANLQVGSVSIVYDGWEYNGAFESFNYSYQDTQQNGGMEWDFSFQAANMVVAD